MQIRYVCRRDLELCLVVWDGTNITPDEWFDHIGSMTADPDFHTCRIHLADLRTASVDASFGKSEVSYGAQLLGKSPDIFVGRKIAIIGGKEFENSLFFQRLLRAQSANIIVFNSLDIACAWLGLDAAEIGAETNRLRENIRSRT